MMRQIAFALATLVVTLIAAPAARAGTPVAGFSDTAVATGLASPTAVAFLPDGRLLVTQKGGALRLVDAGVATTLVTIPVCSASEMGLLGIALDPDFGSNGFVYLYRTNPAPGGCGSAVGRFNEVVRVTMAGDDTIALGTLAVLLSGIQTDNGNHNGGVLRIGPDDKLYVGVGDTGLGDNQGGPGSSTNPYAQDLGQLEGKILRLELDGSPGAGNPFIGVGGAREEIFALGFRNPFRFGFDDVTGRLWVGDVGDLTIEEIDIVAAGDDHAWPHCEGTLPAACQQPGDVDPIFTYPHSGPGALGSSITGGAFAGSSFGGFDEQYFFGDFTARTIYRAEPNPARDDIATPVPFVTGAGGLFGGPADVVFGPDGALHYVTVSPGEVRRVAPVVGNDVPVSGRKLIVVDKLAAAGQAKVVYVSKDTTAGITTGVGTDVDDISAAFTFGYDGASGAFAVPAGGWKANKSTVAKFVNTSAPGGATGVKVLVVKPGKLLKLVGKSVGDTPIDLFAAGAPVGPITTVYEVTNAGETFRFCSTFDPANPAHVVAFKEIAGGTGRKLVAKRGDPVACP
jgi:glucose/arabinose dehydrogenase